MLQLGKRIYNLIEEQFGSGQPNRTIVTLPLVTKKGDFSEKSQAKSHPKSQAKGQASKATMMEARNKEAEIIDENREIR